MSSNKKSKELKEEKIITLFDLLSDKEDDIHKLYDRKIKKNEYLNLNRNTPRKKISVLSDSMWKAMMYNQSRIKYSCKLLSYYLNVSYEELLENLSFGKNELDKRNERNKGERSDFVAYYKDICINIEMNNNNGVEVMERNREYRHRLQSQKVKVGSKYAYTQLLQLNINDFAFEGKEEIKETYFMKSKNNDVESDNEIVINIYVPNLYKKWYTSGIESLTEEERFLLTIIEPDVEKAKELGKDDEIMKEFISEAMEVSKEDDLLEAYDKEWALKDQGYRDGIEQGIEQGITQNLQKIVKRMLEEKVDLDFIMKITGLSKAKIKTYQ